MMYVFATMTKPWSWWYFLCVSLIKRSSLEKDMIIMSMNAYEKYTKYM